MRTFLNMGWSAFLNTPAGYDPKTDPNFGQHERGKPRGKRQTMNQAMTTEQIEHAKRGNPHFRSPNYVVQPVEAPRPPFRVFAVTLLTPAPELEQDGIATGSHVWIDCNLRESCTVKSADGQDILRLDPAEPSSSAVYAPRSLSTAVLEAIGVVPGIIERNDRHRAAGEAWARDALRAAPSDPFEPLTGRRAVFLSTVKDRLVWSFRLPDATANEILGAEAPELPVRSLWNGQDALRLDEEIRVREEQVRAEQERARVAVVEAQRPRTCAELGVAVVAIKRDRPSADNLAPWKDATPLWFDETEIFYGFRSLLGLQVPSYKDAGLRVLEPSELVPPHCLPVSDINVSALGWTRWMISKYGIGDRGPISTWSTEGLPEGERLAAKFAPSFLNPRQSFLWGHLVEVLVRGLRIYPVQTERLIRSALRALEIQRSPPIRVPTQHAERERALAGTDFARPDEAMREIATIDLTAPSIIDPQIAAFCIEAARCGSVGAGALLPSTAHLPVDVKPERAERVITVKKVAKS
jgi:hypothetical protein